MPLLILYTIDESSEQIARQKLSGAACCSLLSSADTPQILRKSIEQAHAKGSMDVPRCAERFRKPTWHELVSNRIWKRTKLEICNARPRYCTHE